MVPSAVDLFRVFRVIGGQKNNRIFTTDNTVYTDESQKPCVILPNARMIQSVAAGRFLSLLPLKFIMRNDGRLEDSIGIAHHPHPQSDPLRQECVFTGLM